MKRINFLIILCFSVLFFVNLPVSVIAEGTDDAGEISRIEVVTSMPVETTLEGAGTRRAADVWIEMIDSAKRSLDFAEFYIISEKNEPLEPVIHALKSASNRGVKIRFLIDKKMLHISTPLMKRLNKIQNLKFRIFDWKDLTGGIIHAKYFIADESTAFIGSQNFDWRALKHIHETGVKISDPGVVGNLIRIFEADWRYNGGDKNAYDFKDGEPEILSNPDIVLTASPAGCNPPGVGSSIKMIKDLIIKSEKKITLQLLSYKTQIYDSDEEFTELYNVMKKAAGRGVELEIAVSDWNLKKPGINSIKDLARVEGIEVKVFSIPEHSSRFIPYARVIHSKVLRVDDDVSMISTSNWGHGYFYGSRNVEVTLRSKRIAVTLDKLFRELWDSEYGSVLDPAKEYIPRKTH